MTASTGHRAQLANFEKSAFKFVQPCLNGVDFDTHMACGQSELTELYANDAKILSGLGRDTSFGGHSSDFNFDKVAASIRISNVEEERVR